MTSLKTQFLRDRLKKIKYHCKISTLPFDLDLPYLEAIATNHCPVFGIKFTWRLSRLGKGKSLDTTPQLDRLVPELGYVKGNVAFLSKRANRMKDDGTMEEHYAIADWIWEQLHAKQIAASSVSDENYPSLEDDPKLRALFATRAWEDYDDFNDYCRELSRQDFNHSTKASSGSGLGTRSLKMVPPEASAYLESIRYSQTKIIRHLNRIGYLYRKFRERCVADGAIPEIPKFSDR